MLGDSGISWGGGGAATSSAAEANGADSLRSLIATKERELHDINEYRLQSLEALLTDKVRLQCLP